MFSDDRLYTEVSVMGFIALDDYPQSWIFRHRDLLISAADYELIQPLDAPSAQRLWSQKISQDASHASHFLSDDWPEHNGVWQDELVDWQSVWDSDETAMPREILDHCQWPDNTVVFFCYDHERVIQTTWGAFKSCWKNFLFYDDEPILLGKRRHEVIRFHSSGLCHIGKRPSL